MNKLTNENNQDITELLSAVKQPMAGLGISALRNTNIVMKWLWRLIDAGYESSKRQGAHDGI